MKASSFLQDFKAFAMKGNVIDSKHSANPVFPPLKVLLSFA